MAFSDAMQEIEIISADGPASTTSVTTSSALLTAVPSLASSSSTSILSATTASTSMSSSRVSSMPAHELPANSAMEVLLAMMAKETTLVADIDFVARSKLSKLKGSPITTATSDQQHDDRNNNNNNNNNNSNDDNLINNTDREKMCEWYYEMTDFLKIDRSTASRSLSYLDRFLHSPHSSHAHYASQLREEYQLAALTTLYVAIKLFERLNIKPSHVSYLSRGRYSSREVVEMEQVILEGLEWKVTSATKMDFANQILNILLPDQLPDSSHDRHRTSHSSSVPFPPSIINGLRDLVHLQIQLSDFDFNFSTQSQSTVAFAAVINAFEIKKANLSPMHQSRLISNMNSLMGHFDHKELVVCIDQLRLLVDPPPPSSFSGNGGNGSPTSSAASYHDHHHNAHHHSQQHQHQHHGNYNNNCHANDENYTDSSSSYYCTADPNIEVLASSTFDAALESMEHNLDMAQYFLCCGAPLTTNDHSNATTTTNNANSNSNNNVHAVHEKKRQNTHSPKTIATILFGGGQTTTTETATSTTTAVLL